MSWLQRLSETYDACFGQPQFAGESDPLLPLCSVPQTTQLHVELWEDGSFAHAQLHELLNTPMFVTEDSASRSGTSPAANPLTEQLEYCAKGLEAYGGDRTRYDRYVKLLSQWAQSQWTNEKVRAVLRYVEGGTLLDDLLREGILSASSEALLKIKVGNKLIPPLKLWVRWSVRTNDLQSKTWSDRALAESWRAFDLANAQEHCFCMLSGDITRTTQKHPKRIRWSGDNAKLISANDDKGFTFRGRFTDSSQALTIGYAATQKAHNALRWLLKRQGTKIGDNGRIVAWSVFNAWAAPVLADSLQFFSLSDQNCQFGSELSENAPALHFATKVHIGDAGQGFALRLGAAIKGYGSRFSDTESIVVLALDSATDGRMAVLYYRELSGSEFLSRLEAWHSNLAWSQRFSETRQFTGAPSPSDIVDAVYGPRKLDGNAGDKLRKATVERLLPCIVEGRPIPRDLVFAAVARASQVSTASKRRGSWAFERVLGVACSLYRGSHPQEFPTMSLDEARLTRDYLYGRLFALANDLEEKALWLAGTNRSTNAARLMQRFSDRPASTWLILCKRLNPYMMQLQSSAPGLLSKYKNLLDTVTARFNDLTNGADQFNSDSRLNGEFLLGFHSQREALRSKRSLDKTSTAPSTEETQGDPE